MPKDSKGRSAVVELAEGSTAFDLVRLLEIPYQDHEGCVAIAIGDLVVEHGKQLSEGDVVTIFPPLAGGLHRAREMTYPL
ncbi:MAG: MoaD/ThiS family protein [Armatimonadetes bacterium]|nr:MoaD/ThiS family protein [Armatimonadota bacterium]